MTMVQLLAEGVVSVCLVGTGVWFTVRSGVFQRHFGWMLRDTLGGKGTRKSAGGISPLRTLSASLGACMGTGNIAGVGTALVTGGAGALFWMCVSAFLGMMTALAETVLAIRYRQKENGAWVGGAMYVLEKGLGLRGSGLLYALLLTLASFGIGNMAQVNAAASAVHTAFGVSPVLVGAVFAMLTLCTMFGGIRRISAVTEKAVPLLSALFLLSACAALFVRRAQIIPALRSVFRAAFDFRAAAGGMAGQAIRVGVTRGIFSNEAGLGSTAVIHACADTDSAVGQGLWAMLEVFLDTVVMCTVTGLVLLTGGTLDPSADGAVLYADALRGIFGHGGAILTAVTLALLGFASLVGWSYCGERGVAYVFGEKALPAYRVLYAAAAFSGSFLRLDTVFRLSDLLDALLALPNLLSLWLLSGTVLRELRMYKTDQLCQHFPYTKKEGRK